MQQTQNADQTLVTTTVESSADAPQVRAGSLTLTGVVWHFHTTDDNKDSDTNVAVGADNKDNVAMARAEIGLGQEWQDNSSISVGTAVMNGVTFESTEHGNIGVLMMPNGDDEWHFDLTLELQFTRGAWRKISWTGFNIAEDRPQARGSW